MTEGKLLCRPKPFDDESLIGYLLRLTEVNGYESLSWIMQMAKLKNYAAGTYNFIYGQSDYSIIALLTGYEKALFEQIVYRPVSVKTERFHGIYEVFGQRISSSVIRHKKPKICPLCLKEDGYCRKFWELAIITACSFHRCLLVSSCRECGKAISWNRQEICRCKCGFDFRESQITVVPENEMIITNKFYSLFGLKAETDEHFPALLNDLNTEQLASLLFLVVGQYYNTTDTTGKVVCKKLNNEEMHRKLNEALEIFSKFPTNFHIFLNNRHKAGETRAATKRKYKTSKRRIVFGGFYRALTVQMAGMEFNFLREAFNRYYEKRELLKNGFKVETGDLKFIDNINESYISVAAAAKILSLTEPTVIRLIGEKTLISIESGAKVPRQKYLLEKASVIEFRNKRKDLILLAKANKILNTHSYQTKQLVQSHLLKQITLGHGFPVWAVVFNRQDVRAILNGIDRNSIKNAAVDDNNKLISFAQTVNKLSKHGLNFGALVELVLQKKLKPIRKDSAGGVHRYYFKETEINRFVLSVTESKLKETYSLEETQARLEINKRTVFWLYRNGFLSGKRYKGKITSSLRFDRESVFEFRNNFVMASELFEDRKITQERILKIMATKGIFPVNQNKSEYYVFEKKLVKNIKLINSETILKIDVHTLEETANLLKINTQEVCSLVKNGALKPYGYAKNRQGMRFSSYIIARAQQLGIVNLNVYSTKRAAEYLKLPGHVFLAKYVKTGRIKPMLDTGKREYYFWKNEILELAEVENSRISTTEAAKILGVNASCIHKLILAGQITPISGPNIDGYLVNAYSRNEIEALYKKRLAYKTEQLKAGKSDRFGRSHV